MAASAKMPTYFFQRELSAAARVKRERERERTTLARARTPTAYTIKRARKCGTDFTTVLYYSARQKVNDTAQPPRRAQLKSCLPSPRCKIQFYPAIEQFPPLSLSLSLARARVYILLPSAKWTCLTPGRGSNMFARKRTRHARRNGARAESGRWEADRGCWPLMDLTRLNYRPLVKARKGSLGILRRSSQSGPFESNGLILRGKKTRRTRDCCR